MLMKYKNIVFDEYVDDEKDNGNKDSNTVWVEVCKNHANEFKKILGGKIDEGGCGACSVKGCSVVGADDDIEMFYVDFDKIKDDLILKDND